MSASSPIDGLRPIVRGTIDVGQQAEANDLADDVADARAARDAAAKLSVQRVVTSRVSNNRNYDVRKQTGDAKRAALERGRTDASDKGEAILAREAQHADAVRAGTVVPPGAGAGTSPQFERGPQGLPRFSEAGQAPARVAADPIDGRVEARVTEGLSSFDPKRLEPTVLAKAEASTPHDDPKQKAERKKPETPQVPMGQANVGGKPGLEMVPMGKLSLMPRQQHVGGSKSADVDALFGGGGFDDSRSAEADGPSEGAEAQPLQTTNKWIKPV